jgi:predicted amidophosphoribosyltransferase
MKSTLSTQGWQNLFRGGVCSAIDLIFPPYCAYCQQESESGTAAPQLCDGCVQRLLFPNACFCPRCGAVNRKGVDGGAKCVECRRRRLRFDAVRALSIYRGDMQRAVIRMKSRAGQVLATSVGLLMADRLDFSDQGEAPDVACCVPKHWLRRAMRGTNSAETLMSAITWQRGLPALRGLLRCRRNMNKQSMLTLHERFRNVRGALRVGAGYDIATAHILVVDDIMTTGATASEAARVLKRAGARRVTIAVAGRAVSAL